MTLILNEIHVQSSLEDTFIVVASDRRLTNPDGSFRGTRKKLFEIPYIQGAISYFGAAVIPNGQRPFLADWLPKFISHHSDIRNIGDFAVALQSELNHLIWPSVLAQVPSGFHICGYQEQGYPDFWYFSNIGRLEPFRYADLQGTYAKPESHFLGRDAVVDGWNGRDPSSLSYRARYYRNGDFRAHAIAWERLDAILRDLSTFPDFPLPTTRDEYEALVRFKFNFIAYLYQERAKHKLIGKPIDVLILIPPPVTPPPAPTAPLPQPSPSPLS